MENTAQSAAEFLADWGLRPEDLLSYVDALRPSESALLVGSIVEGLANPLSDIDLLLMGDGGLGSTFIQRELVSEETATRLPGGQEIHLEYWHTDALDQLRGRLSSTLEMINDTSQRRELSRLSESELRLLHRLRGGLVLANREVAEHWRAQLHLDSLPLYLVIHFIALHFVCREDAIAQVRYGGDALTALTMLRLASEHLAAAMIASTGETNHSRKWRPRLLTRERAGLGEERVAELLRYLFPNPYEDPEALLGGAIRLFDIAILEIVGRCPDALPVLFELDEVVSFVKDLETPTLPF